MPGKKTCGATQMDRTICTLLRGLLRVGFVVNDCKIAVIHESYFSILSIAKIEAILRKQITDCDMNFAECNVTLWYDHQA